MLHLGSGIRHNMDKTHSSLDPFANGHSKIHFYCCKNFNKYFHFVKIEQRCSRNQLLFISYNGS